MGKHSQMVTATGKAWVAKGGATLVPDMHKDACVLFARKGQSLKIEHVTRFPNAADFFAGFPASGKKEVEKDEIEELTIPQIKERCTAAGLDFSGCRSKADFVQVLKGG